MTDAADIWRVCPELAVELAKIEIELIFQEFEEALFRLLKRMADTD